MLQLPILLEENSGFAESSRRSLDISVQHEIARVSGGLRAVHQSPAHTI